MPKPLLIQVSLHYRPIGGGQEVYIRNLSQVLGEAGWETKVLQPNRGEQGGDNVLIPRIPGIQRFVPFFDEAQFAIGVGIGAASWLNRASIILCHYAATAAVISRIPAWRKKMIVLSHGVEWNVDRMNSHDRARERNAKRLFGQVATVANDTDYLRRMGCQAEPGRSFFSEVAPGVWFVPNAVDTKRFAPRATRYAGVPACTVLVPRQICEDRGIHLAIDSFALFAQKQPNVTMHIVGPVRGEAYYQRCISLVNKYGMQERVLFMPPVSNDRMPELYRAAHVTLIPTLRREGTSLSALESMACGTPAVVTDVAGLKDLPADRCAADAASVAEGIARVVDNRVEESIRQRDSVLRHFGHERWATTWLNILNCLMKSSNSRRNV